jgi:hypothetical protein
MARGRTNAKSIILEEFKERVLHDQLHVMGKFNTTSDPGSGSHD